ELYWRSGRRAQADSVLRIVCGGRAPANWCSFTPGPFLLRADTAGARASLHLLRERTRMAPHYLNPGTVAAVQFTMGDKAAAFASLEEALSERTATLTAVAQDPSFDALHAHPQFASIVHRAGLDTKLMAPVP